MNSSAIRDKFISYFENLKHQHVKSSSLIPAADPTLLFTNAGMVQFKDAFLGVSKPSYSRATTAQKCVRAGGKHNDLENVGFTPRHHTFFEMLGNFSFGDYFKKEAIAFAWYFLTEELKIPKDRLRITVFEDDDEALELWKAQGVRPDWIERLGEKDNFWAMGDTGPCGPCTEIHYDWGEKYGNAPSPGKDESGKRFLEIWNLVFMQFSRDTNGKLTPLPKPSVDTGAGLERLSAVMQGAYSNYDTDLFQPLIQTISKQVRIQYGADPDTDVAMRVIADHLRSSTFLIADGVIPSNEGRGYVLRRILRRAIRYGKKLGQEKPFIYSCVGAVVKSLSDCYPEIQNQKSLVETFIREEEEKFHETLHRGLGILEEAIQKDKQSGAKILSGDTAFLLYDSYGFPLDLVEVICREQGLLVDSKAFESLMEKQRLQSGKEKNGDKKLVENLFQCAEQMAQPTVFVGYDHLETRSKLIQLCNDQGQEVSELKGKGYAIFDSTPFYAESGGQVGDRGSVESADVLALVHSTQKTAKQFLLDVEVKKGKLQKGQSYLCKVDPVLRRFTMRNHTATHLLHAALRRQLGERVKQAGSLVEPDRLRFDFTFPKAVPPEELKKIEALVNEQVLSNSSVLISEMTYDEAIQSGALAFFDEKYGDRVRVVRVGDKNSVFSVELCGGTHLNSLLEIGYCKIISESSVASGVRRIEAVTSLKAFEYLSHREALFSKVETALASKQESAVEKLESLQLQLKNLTKENEQLRIKSAQAGKATSPSNEASTVIKGVRLVVDTVDESDPKILRALVDQLRDKGKENTLVMLLGTQNGRVAMCVGITKDLLGKFDAGKIVQMLAPEIEGKGGGRPDFAQAGGTQPAGIPSAVSKLKTFLASEP